MIISVIVPCRNERKYIEPFLEAVLSQQRDPGWELEILVADGRSNDGTREILARAARGASVRLIDNPQGIVSTGLNAAIEASRGEIVIRMDVHTEYAPDYIRECVHALQYSGADNVGGPWVARGEGFVSGAIAAAFRMRFCTGGGRAHDPGYEGEVDTVYLGCWRREIFQRIGGFDPGLVRNQDDEFNFRLRRSGGRVWQTPRIRSSYSPRASLLALFRQYMQYGYWKTAVIRKHRALASWRHAVPALFVFGLVFLAGLWLVAAAMHSAAVATVAGSALLILLMIYMLSVFASALFLYGSLPLRSWMILPAVIATYHFAYGSGFLIGAVSPPRNSGGPSADSRFFTALTR
jgi:succinoglycan biosynthesis protein ExoA